MNNQIGTQSSSTSTFAQLIKKFQETEQKNIVPSGKSSEHRRTSTHEGTEVFNQVNKEALPSLEQRHVVSVFAIPAFEDSSEIQASGFSRKDFYLIRGNLVQHLLGILAGSYTRKYRKQMNEFRNSSNIMSMIKEHCIEIFTSRLYEQYTESEKAEFICQLTKDTVTAVCAVNQQACKVNPYWTANLDAPIHADFEEIMKYRMKAATHFELKKREILKELASEKLFKIVYSIDKKYYYLNNIYAFHLPQVIDSLEGLANYKPRALKRVIHTVVNALYNFAYKYGLSPYGSDLKCIQNLVDLIKDLTLPEAQKMELIVYVFARARAFEDHDFLWTALGDHADLNMAKAYLASLNPETNL